jgi:hypothetical protein
MLPIFNSISPLKNKNKNLYKINAIEKKFNPLTYHRRKMDE